MVRVRLVEGEIAGAGVDAIVSPETAAPGSPCETRPGEVRVTSDGPSLARYVIHTANLALVEGSGEEALRASIRRSLEVARDRGLQSVAFPAFKVRGLSMQQSAEIMLEEVETLEAPGSLEEIRFVLSGEPTFRLFEQVKDAGRIREQLRRLRP